MSAQFTVGPACFLVGSSLRNVLILGLGMLGACYMSPETSIDSADAAADGSGLGAPQGPLDEDNQGTLEDGDVRLYWRTRDAWQAGACVDLLLRNTGDSTLRLNELRLSNSEAFTYWASAGGAVFWPDGGELTIWPESSSLSAGSFKQMYFCAEPAADLVAMEADVTASSSGSGGSDGSDGSDGSTEEPEINAGAFVEDGFVLNWRVTWEDPDHGGTCMEFRAVNETDEPIDVGAISLEMTGEFLITHSYGVTPTVLSEGLGLMFPSYLGDIPPFGEGLSDQWVGTVCMEPIQTPTSMSVVITP